MEQDQDDANLAIKKGTIFVGRLNPKTTKDDLLAYFSKFGTVKRVDIKLKKATGESRGYGFVRFTDTNTLEDGVLEACHFLDGRRLNVQPARLRGSVSLPWARPRVQLSCLLACT
ncbi:unnamed protein product [Dibothriocephalus latus]|uniref:RRM domain-containing protein n=1 Tax=Dibothriocephalus latus TaxID=60516 RepID=A0A3P7P0T0_DIBLA|nr:unnamed protein product [Dibothriocephalus latus]